MSYETILRAVPNRTPGEVPVYVQDTRDQKARVKPAGQKGLLRPASSVGRFASISDVPFPMTTTLARGASNSEFMAVEAGGSSGWDASRER